MTSALCSFCPPQVHPQKKILPWLQDHLENFHNITHKTEAVLSLAFLNSKETIKLQQLVNSRKNKFLEKGEFDTNGNIFEPALGVVPWVDETLVREDKCEKDWEVSNKEQDTMQDHLQEDSNGENPENKDQISDQELKDIQDLLLADCSDDSDEEENEETLGETPIKDLPKDILDEGVKDTVTKLKEALGLTPPDLLGYVNMEEMVKVELIEEDENTDNFCRLCYTSLNTFNTLEEHNLTEHNEDQEALNMEYSLEALVHPCIHCPLKFLTNNLLITHKEVMHKIGLKKSKVKCKICDKLLKGSNISQHNQTHGEATFECKLCYTKFKLDKYLVSHQKSIHKNDQNLLGQELREEDLKYKCKNETCFQKFPTKDILDYHLRYGHKDNIIIYNCTYCTQLFSSPRTLQKHVRKAHGKRASYKVTDKQHGCKLCYRLFSKKENLKSHMKIHSEDQEAFLRTIGDEDLVYTCQSDGCGQKFISEHILKYHFNSNHREMEYKHLQKGSAKSETTCPLCYLLFKSFYTMHSHLLDSHIEDKDLLKEGALQISPELECIDCELKFIRPSILLYHKSRVHRGYRKRFQCEDCPLQFKLYRKLRLHTLKVHMKKLGRREGYDHAHECKLCYRKFESRSTMTKHQKMLHPEDVVHLNRDILKEELLFNCVSCSKSFISEHILTYHKNRQHRGQLHCILCYYSYKKEWSLKVHIKRLHTTKEEIDALESQNIDKERLVYACQECHQKFLTENILTFHTRYRHTTESQFKPNQTKSGNGGKKYCKLCYLKFKGPSDLHKHKENIHKDEMTLFDIKIEPAQLIHTCKQCSRKFLSDKILAYHTRYIHKEKYGVEKYCKLCYIKFDRPSVFRKHQKSLHQEEMFAFTVQQEIEDLKFPCNHCDKKFMSENILQFHKRLSHKIKPSGQAKTCQYCNKHFSWDNRMSSKFNKHMKRVHGVDRGQIEETTEPDEALVNFQYMMAMLNKRNSIKT